MLQLTVGYCVIHRKYNNRRWVAQGVEPSFLPNLVCDQICQPSNEDEDEMKIDSRYRTDPNWFCMFITDCHASGPDLSALGISISQTQLSWRLRYWIRCERGSSLGMMSNISQHRRFHALLDVASGQGGVPMAVGNSSCYQVNSENGNNSSCYQFCLNLVDSSRAPVFVLYIGF